MQGFRIPGSDNSLFMTRFMRVATSLWHRLKHRGTSTRILMGMALGMVALAMMERSPFPRVLFSKSPTANAQTETFNIRLTLPLQPNSIRFAVIGDSGSGSSNQYDVAAQMQRYRTQFPFEFVLMLGDNLYGGDRPKDFAKEFEIPYKNLLDAGVAFYASLGNHDKPNERFYKPFHMGGQRYYSFKKGDVQFFALDSDYMDPQQLTWLEKELHESNARWKISFFHHPLYSDGKFHGPDVDLRALLSPLLKKYGVNVVLSGHEHVYERITPQQGVYYFIVGNSGKLRLHGLRAATETVKGYDVDETFMLVEITGDQFWFQTISRTGETVDSGVLPRKTTASAGSDRVN